MTDRSTDQIRDLLASEMSVAPEPHPWGDVEQRARLHDDTPLPARRRAGVWLAVAACTIALVGGLVAVIGSDHEPTVPADVDRTTPSAPASTSIPAPTPTTPDTEAGWNGGLLDDLDTEALRPLQSFTEGDVVIPTSPSGWRAADTQWTNPEEAAAPDFVEWIVEVIEVRPPNALGPGLGHVLYLTQSREPTCNTTLGCKPSGESVTINGVVWESIVVERIPEDDDEFFDATTLRARVADRWVSLQAGAPQALDGPLLANPPIIEFLEGLRVGSPDDLAVIGEACWQCGTANAEGDPFAAGSPNAAPAEESGGAATTTTDSRAQAPTDVDADTGRPLTDLTTGDVVVPTYIPDGLELQDTARNRLGDQTTEFSFALVAADGESSITVRLWEGNPPWSPLGPEELQDPNHPAVDLAGLTWGWIDFEHARAADVGSFSVWVYLDGLDRSEAERFIEGLRAVPADQYPGPITRRGADGG